MNKSFRIPPTAYEADIALWSAEQGAMLRAGQFERLDRMNLAEEIESLARSDKREIERRLNKLLVHLLKWQFQPEKRKSGWRSTIRDQRTRMAKLVKESPSLRDWPAQELDDEYRSARLNASDETKLAERLFPEKCPYTIEQVLDPDFLPE